MKSYTNNILHRFSINLFFVLFLTLSHWGFSQNLIQPEIQKSTLLFEKTAVSEDLTYKMSEKGSPVLLDIYTPKITGNTKIPVVIYVHGGGWVEGDKTIRADSYIENTILKLTEKQYAVISINYTLLDESTHFPTPVEDTKDVVRWVRKNAGKYNFDTNNIGFFGTSAGAHLSMLSAYTPDTEFVGDPELSKYSGKVNYVIDNFGPSDMNSLLHTRTGKIPVFFIGLFSKKIVDLREKLVLGITGYDIKKDKRKVVKYCKTISPISYVNDGVPTLIIQGNKDQVVPLKQSKKLHRKLKKEGVQNTLTIVEDGLHGFRTTEKAELDKIVEEMVSFIVSQKK